jgi:putative aldouronate transport system substrate-binding protein
MKEAVVKLHQYYVDGLIDPGAFVGLESEGQSYYNSPPFWNGRIGYTVAGTWYNANPPLFEGDLGSNFYQQFKNLQGENATYAEGPPLTGPGGMGLFKWTLLTGYGLGLGIQVENQPEKMDKIMEIFRRTTATRRRTFSCGRHRGRDVYLDYNVIMTPKELLENSQLNSYYTRGANGMALMCNNFEMLEKYTYRPERLEYILRVANYTNNWENALIGALPSSGQYKTTIEGLIETNYAQFITGQRDLAEWDTFVQELYNAGLTVLEAEAKAWYDKYFKK